MPTTPPPDASQRPPAVAPLPTGEHWSAVHAFGLPAGSVRAILTLSILGTACGLLWLRPEQPLPGYLRDLMFLILGHYYALRRTAGEPIQAGPPPLFLPRGTVRILILVGFATVIVLLIRQGTSLRPTEDTAASALPLVIGFLLGTLTRGISQFTDRRRGRPPYRFFTDLRAVIALLSAALVIMLAWNHVYDFLPAARLNVPARGGQALHGFGWEHIFGAVVGFYFGARS